MEQKTRRILTACISMIIPYIITLLVLISRSPTNHDNYRYLFIVVIFAILCAVIGFLDHKTKSKAPFVWFCIVLLIVPALIIGLLAYSVDMLWVFWGALIVGGIFFMLAYYTLSMILQKYLDKESIFYGILIQILLIAILTMILVFGL